MHDRSLFLTNEPSGPPRRLRWWLLGHAAFFLLLWPAFAVWHGARVVRASGVAGGMELEALRWGCLVAALAMWRELLVTAALLATATALAGLLSGGRVHVPRAAAVAAGSLAALLGSLALLLGISLELPAALHHPALRFAGGAPVWAVQAGLALLVAGDAVLAGKGARTVRPVAVAAALVWGGWALVRYLPDGQGRRAPAGMRIVLGLDSISRLDEVEGLRRLAVERGGTWYERAVTPGLITNSVWWSILTGEPPHRTGVFFVFQAPDPGRLPPTLVSRAKAEGLRTCAFFSDQLTMQVGADVPFDENHSGPRGWLQITTAAVKDAGWFLPAVLPHLPPIPGAATPANQSHTYAFSLRRELAELLTCGGGPGGSLTLAHVDYLHQACYPGMSQLGPAERARVRRAPLSAVVDRSIDWQYPFTKDEPLRIYSWKLAELQVALREVVERTGVLDPARGNQLVVLSDHGQRTGLKASTFGDERYHSVVLVTFGVPARDPAAPISLLDVGALLGLAPSGPTPREPAVEYVEAERQDWKELVRGSAPLLDGRVASPRATLVRMGNRLGVYRPFTEPRGYSTVSAAPALERGGEALHVPASP